MGGFFFLSDVLMLSKNYANEMQRKRYLFIYWLSPLVNQYTYSTVMQFSY